MPKAFVVRVMNKQMPGSPPLRVLYAVVLESEQDALKLVQGKAGPEVDVEVIGQLASGTVKALKLMAGQISML